jgi:hypothetical protein
MSSVLGSGAAVNEPRTPFGWQDAIAEELADVSSGKTKRNSVYVKIATLFRSAHPGVIGDRS